MSDCWGCNKENVEVKRCAKCRHAFYCSRACQSGHWNRHKPNCIPHDSSLHELISACAMDTWPVPAAYLDYGFDKMKTYHGDVLWKHGMTAQHILLGLYQAIKTDVFILEDQACMLKVSNSIRASKRMILKAYENNALDDFLQRYVRNVIDINGDRSPAYCFAWLKFKLIIGPTRLLLSDSVCLTEQQILDMRSDVYRKYYDHE